MVTTGGSIFLWNSRPAKIIQPLAPFFTEIDENLEYIEKEDEFEHEVTEEDVSLQSLTEDEKKKHKLAKNIIDAETIDPNHMCTYSQINAFKLSKKGEGFSSVLGSIPVQVSASDSYG